MCGYYSNRGQRFIHIENMESLQIPVDNDEKDSEKI